MADELTGKVIGEAIRVHPDIGPGLLEHVYERCLAYRLETAGLKIKRQVWVDIQYETLTVKNVNRIDILVNDELVVEVKSDEKTIPRHKSQLITYLRVGKLQRGLLLNFNNVLMKDGIFRLFPHSSPGEGADGLSP